jgi:hypothetical protein
MDTRIQRCQEGLIDRLLKSKRFQGGLPFDVGYAPARIRERLLNGQAQVVLPSRHVDLGLQLAASECPTHFIDATRSFSVFWHELPSS